MGKGARMYRSLTRVVAPGGTPVTLAEAKQHVRRTDDTDDDTKLTALVNAAVQHLDGPSGVLGRAIVEQQWDAKFDRFPVGDVAIRLPLPPLITVDQVTYVDTLGATQTLAASVYQVVGPGSAGFGELVRAHGQSWPSTRAMPEAVTVRFTCGWEATEESPPDYTANVPDDIRQAIMIMVAEWYENREETVIGASVNALPRAASSLLATHRMRWF